MGRSSSAGPVKNPSTAFPMDNCPSRKGFPSWLSLSPPLSSCALCLWLLIFFTSHQPSLPLCHPPRAVCGLTVTASPAPAPAHFRSSRAVFWLPSALPSITPYLIHTLLILLLLFDSDQTPTKVAGYCQEARKGGYPRSPPLLPCARFSFLFPPLSLTPSQILCVNMPWFDFPVHPER